MPQPSGTFQDGTLSFGSQQVTINTVAYIADDINYDVGTKVITRPNEFGVPQAEVLITEVGTGKMTLQVPASAAIPPLGSTTSIKDIDGATTINIKLSKIGRTFKADGEIKVPVEFRQKLN